LHLQGRELKEVEGQNSPVYVKFGTWFYKKFDPNMVKPSESVEARRDEDFFQYQKRVEERVKANTEAGESVLICIG